MTNQPAPYGARSRGVDLKDVAHAADELLRSGERPTVERIRARIGSGSPNTIGPLLDTWWKGLSSRLDNGPAAFHRLPESVSHIAEAMWLQALDEARSRAELEQTLNRRSTSQDRERVDIRSHVLALREAEMASRLKERDDTINRLESRLQLSTSTLRREQAGRDELTRRLAVIEGNATARRPAKSGIHKRKKTARRSPTAKRKTVVRAVQVRPKAKSKRGRS